MFNKYYITIGNKKLTQILKIVTTMADETLQELKALAQRASAGMDQANTSLANIKEDITRIKDGLPTAGGLTADEVAQLKVDLEGAAGKAEATAASADALDKENEPE